MCLVSRWLHEVSNDRLGWLASTNQTTWLTIADYHDNPFELRMYTIYDAPFVVYIKSIYLHENKICAVLRHKRSVDTLEAV